MALQKEQIRQAAETLVERGEKPTIRAVRQELGRGSEATIGPVLRAWRKEREAEDSLVSEVPEPPSEVQDQTEKLMRAIWKSARETAWSEVESREKAAKQAVDDAEDQLRQTEEVLRDVQRERDELAERVEILERERDEQAQRAEAAEKQAAEQVRRAEMAEQRVADRDGRIADLQEQRDQLAERANAAEQRLDVVIRSLAGGEQGDTE